MIFKYNLEKCMSSFCCLFVIFLLVTFNKSIRRELHFAAFLIIMMTRDGGSFFGVCKDKFLHFGSAILGINLNSNLQNYKFKNLNYIENDKLNL